MKKYAILLLATLFMCSCSAILNGTSQMVEIETTPANVQLTIDDSINVNDGDIVSLDRISQFIEVKAELPGYRTKNITLRKDFETAFLLEAIVFPFMIIDGMIGSVFGLPNNKLLLKLEVQEDGSVTDETWNINNKVKPNFESIEEAELFVLYSDKPIKMDSVQFDDYNQILTYWDMENGSIGQTPYSKIINITQKFDDCEWHPYSTLGLATAGITLGLILDSNCQPSPMGVGICGATTIYLGAIGLASGIYIDNENYNNCKVRSVNIDSLK